MAELVEYKTISRFAGGSKIVVSFVAQGSESIYSHLILNIIRQTSNYRAANEKVSFVPRSYDLPYLLIE